MEVVVLERFTAEALAYLKAQDGIHVSENLKTTEAVIIRSKTKINKDFFAQTPNLKIIVTSTSGYDHIDLEETKNRNIRVFYTPDANAQSAAELTWALLLSLVRKIPLAVEAIRNEDWNRDRLLGHEIHGRVLGIIGLGRVGTRVAKMASGFGMKVVAYDPYVDQSVFKTLNCERLGMTELVRIADVISLHVPYTRETHHMMNARSLEDVQPHTILINTSRGPVVLEQELAQMLQDGRLAGAGLDVFTKEPLPKDSPLFQLKNVVLTPHIGATTEDAFQRASMQAAQTVIDFFNGKTMENELFPISTQTFKKF